MIRALKLSLLAILALFGCTTFQNIPAQSTPVRNVRYYQTQDVANFAAGAGADLALRSLCHGPTQQIAVEFSQRDSAAPMIYRRSRWFSGGGCPVARVGIVTGLGIVRRQTDRGYREGGLFMNLYGAGLTEVLHLIVDAVTKHWGPISAIVLPLPPSAQAA